jgi:hypothetical protein
LSAIRLGALNAELLGAYQYFLESLITCLVEEANEMTPEFDIQDLRLNYNDGPATPVYNLIQEIVNAVQPRMFITTGTGG